MPNDATGHVGRLELPERSGAECTLNVVSITKTGALSPSRTVFGSETGGVPLGL